LQDGAYALDFIFCRRAYAHRHIADHPKMILLDLKLPKVSGLKVLRQIKFLKQSEAAHCAASDCFNPVF
jgi:DNA-binding response OmpR family regulator